MIRNLCSVSALPFAVVLFCSVSVAFANPVIERANGDWGFELVPDMTCATNPARLRFLDNGRKAEFTWPKSVTYSDGTVSEAVTFTVTSTDGNRINMRRDRDGKTGYLILSANAMSYKFGLDSGIAAGEGESVFTRCDKLIS